jgi:hypothetical protein
LSRRAQIRASEQMRDRIADYLHQQGIARTGSTSRKDALLFAMERVVRAMRGRADETASGAIEQISGEHL